jgi:carboxylesterase type B
MAFAILSLVAFSLQSALALPAQSLAADDIIAATTNGQFQGQFDQKWNITHFRRIPFAASTGGANRFRAPQPLPPMPPTIYDSRRGFDMCPQRENSGSEDCLYLGIYSRPWTNGTALRPVLVTFYGGGFIRGSATFDVTPSAPPSGFPVLNASVLNDYVVVYPNYRTNMFGFLPGRKMKEHPGVDLNVGLLDQQAALQWVQKNIFAFGGDKANVTIWGQSAGGGSVLAQAIATGNREKGLFKKAMASSPYWPKTYKYDDPEAEEIFEQTVKLAGCKGKEDEVQCLKDADLQVLRTAALKIADSHALTTSSYTWAPFLDGEFLAEELTEVVSNQQVNAESVFTTYNLHEGENFIPAGFSNAAGLGGFNSSAESFDAWLRGFLPRFSNAKIEELKKLYPSQGTAEEISYKTTYERAGLIYRDAVLACPAYWVSKAAKNGWIAEYTISPAKHASDVKYVSKAISPADTKLTGC